MIHVSTVNIPNLLIILPYGTNFPENYYCNKKLYQFNETFVINFNQILVQTC